LIDPRKNFDGLNVTINTGEACNLACKYCYENNKRPNRMTLDVAKRFIDLILNDPDPCGIVGTKDEKFNNLGLILDFIGGEPLMEVELIRGTIEHFISQAVLLNHKWAFNWRISISTNGTLLDDPAVQKFCRDYKENLSIGVSIDGCKTYHDLNRIYPDGRGSLDIIMKNWEFYREIAVDAATKSTLNKEGIPFIFDSLKFLHEDLGLKYINQNFIFEDMDLNEEDLKEIDRQFEKCVAYVHLHHDDLYWSMIDKRFLDRANTSCEDSEWCGSGLMPAVAPNGKIYPCFRWLPHSQKNVDMSVGDVFSGMYKKETFGKVRAGGHRCNITKDDKCKSCEIEKQCAYCSASCFAEYGEFKRQTHICEITKLQDKWAHIYWKEELHDQSEQS